MINVEGGLHKGCNRLSPPPHAKTNVKRLPKIIEHHSLLIEVRVRTDNHNLVHFIFFMIKKTKKGQIALHVIIYI